VADSTDEEKREFDQIYQGELVDRKQRAESFEVAEHVETPEGPAVIVTAAMGGYRVKLAADLPAPRPGHIDSQDSGEGAFFVPTSLLRKSEPPG
jgi:hypothetical protein